MRPAVLGALLLLLPLFWVFRAHHFKGPEDLHLSTAPRVALDASVSPRKIYPLSVIHGGAYSEKELERARKTDAVVSAHYADFGTRPKFQKLSHDLLMYVSYRRSNQVYWSKTKHRIPQGETVISDGNCMARARCGNRLSATAKSPIAPKEVSEEMLNTPEAPDEPVSYKLAELPGPQGRSFNLLLPAAESEAGSPGSAGPAARVVGTPGGTNALATFFPSGPGIGGIGGSSGPLIVTKGSAASSPSSSTTAASSSSAGAATSPASSLPTTTTGGSTLPVSSSYPGPTAGTGTGPGGTPGDVGVGLVPEPQSFSYTLLAVALASGWLARRRVRAQSLRG